MNHLLNNIQGWAQNGYAGNHLMAQAAAVTDVGVAAGGLGTSVAAAIVQFNKAAIMPNIITMQPAPAGTNTVKFPVYTKHDPTDANFGVDEQASGAEETIANLTSIETTAVSCEVLRRAIRAEISDLSAHGNDDALLVNAARQLGNDVARKFDVELLDLCDNFTNAVGHDNALTFSVFMDAVATLEANDAPRPYNAVLHPQQVYGSYGLSNEFSVAGTPANGGTASFGHGSSDGVKSSFMDAGFVTSLAGVGIYTTTAVLTGDTGRKEGGMFSKEAIGCGYIDFGGGSFIQMASEREEAYAKTTLVANAYYAGAELVDVYGVEIDTEIS
tara:strand:- start:2165 stop:3151 length:987 start_codon:yes stop_codon:yes gene_type:complete